MRKTIVISCVFVCLSCMLFGAETKKGREASSLLVEAVQLFSDNKIKEAYARLNYIVSNYPDNDAAHYYLGHVLAMTGNVDSSLVHMEKAYKQDTLNYWYASCLARLYGAANKTDKALTLYERLTKEKPGDLEVISDLVDVYIDASRYDEAEVQLAKLEQLNGVSEYTMLRRIDLARQRGEYQKFFGGLKEYFTMSERPDSDMTDLLNKLINGSDPRFNYAHLNDYEELVNTCLNQYPSDTSVLHFAAGFFYSLKKYEKVRALYKQSPKDLQIGQMNVYTYIFDKDYKSAARYCQELIENHTDLDAKELARLHSLMGDCYQNNGNSNKAFKEYDISLSLNPDDPMTLNNYAYFMACQGKRYDKCAKMSRKVLDLVPDNAIYIDTYAWILYKMGKLKESRKYFKRAMLYGGKEEVEILQHYAEVLEALGEKDLAEGYRQQARLKRDEKKD